MGQNFTESLSSTLGATSSRNMDLGNAGQNHDLLTANKSYENVVKFKYLRMTVTQNYIHDKLKSRLNLGNAWYHLV